ncbi:hypothetical protein CYMTET_31953 [Cymbomonas tetramitiformis]|uniref:Uncharacterized protein n=1 Tax=Cymbomonas tetramitiformis TaxID=36881 RepID=A0AAE0FG38_9CHLO|nr:hypothetical protein CYMTET_31953 [Cymbomonas tetramitiformis]
MDEERFILRTKGNREKALNDRNAASPNRSPRPSTAGGSPPNGSKGSGDSLSNQECRRLHTSVKKRAEVKAQTRHCFPVEASQNQLMKLQTIEVHHGPRMQGRLQHQNRTMRSLGPRKRQFWQQADQLFQKGSVKVLNAELDLWEIDDDGVTFTCSPQTNYCTCKVDRNGCPHLELLNIARTTSSFLAVKSKNL